VSKREPGQPLTYEQAGVNLSMGEYFSEAMTDASRQTWKNREGDFGQVEAISESFTSFRAVPLAPLERHNLRDLSLDLPADGVGTKIEISERLNNHSKAAFDLLAMMCDDPAAEGMTPIFSSNVIDVRKLRNHPDTIEFIGQIASGFIEACEAAGIANLRGEVAELGDRVNGYGEFNYNWSGSVVSIVHKERKLTGLKVEPGQVLVGCKEEGFRSNGLSLVRAALHERFGPEWHNKTVRKLGDLSLGEQVQVPSRIYTRFMTELTGGYDIFKNPRALMSAFAHITGGGQPGKLGRTLEPSGFGAIIDKPLEPLPLMRVIQDIAQVPDREIYSTLNMGTGLIGITAEPDNFIKVASEFGIKAQEIGVVTEEPGIRIKNMGAQQEDKYLTF
jgi:phosphoribosylformylglycinamidine cyclo-ligase